MAVATRIRPLPRVFCYPLKYMRGQSMRRQLSIATRKELIKGVRQHYRTSNHQDKPKILEEFVRLPGYHRPFARVDLSPCDEPNASSVGMLVRETLYERSLRRHHASEVRR